MATKAASIFQSAGVCDVLQGALDVGAVAAHIACDAP